MTDPDRQITTGLLQARESANRLPIALRDAVRRSGTTATVKMREGGT